MVRKLHSNHVLAKLSVFAIIAVLWAETGCGGHSDLVSGGTAGRGKISGSVASANLLIAEGSGASGVYDFNAKTGAYLGYLPASNPVGLTSDAVGNIYISELGNSDIIKYVPGSKVPSVFISTASGGLSAPRAISFGPDGNLYVASHDTGRILKFNGTTGSYIGDFASLPSVFGLTWAGGNLYADSDSVPGIFEFNGNSGKLITSTPGAPYSGYMISSGTDGTIYQAAGTVGCVSYSPTSLGVVGHVIKGHYTYSLRCLSSGGVAVGDIGDSSCSLYGPGFSLQGLVISGGSGPQDVLATPDLSTSGMLTPPPNTMLAGGIFTRWTYQNQSAEEVEIELTSSNSPGSDKGLSLTNQFTCGTPSESNTLSFGIQTNIGGGTSKGVVFSRDGTSDGSNTMVAPNLPTGTAWSVFGSSGGGSVGVRRLIDWGFGKTTLTIRSMPEKDDGIGRWFGVWLSTPSEYNAFCGALRFPIDHSGAYPSLTVNGSGTFVQNYFPVESSSANVPYWNFSLNSIRADGVAPQHISYYYTANQLGWPNSNIQTNQAGMPIQFTMGGSTIRTSPPNN